MWPHPRRTEPLKGAIADARRTRKMVRTTLIGQSYAGHLLELDPRTIRVEGCAIGICGGQNMSRIKQLLPPPSGAGEAFGLLGDAEQRLRLVDAFLLLETQQTSRSSITDHKAGG